ncbi:hypothetical protein PY093_16000 [Cytobacillus sp. S13-E01]|uniref:hypothetical protein n=1 Tax=Cytobacillus sp. S13-E01 TaxID=3031326 RepID=UPI0023D7FA68|nr:hypothetical protein [Cytobacillus sp. S13-E01]MDF0728168.1 hypothetical protein [Cytobacillus sp. S13-E01]
MKIVIYDVIKVKKLEGSATFSIGKSYVRELTSQTKNNVIGQVTGDHNEIFLKPIRSPIIDLDRLENWG